MKDDSSYNKQLEFTEEEIEVFQKMKYAGQLPSYKDIPHIATVSYIYENGFNYFSTDYNTRKYQNLEKNRRIAVIVDIYDSSVNNKAVVIQGIVEFIEKSKEFKRLYQELDKKFQWVWKDPWKEDEAPSIKVKPKISWGLGQNRINDKDTKTTQHDQRLNQILNH